MSLTLPILHFNDVYRVRQKDKATGGTIGADQFAAKIQAIRETWGEPSDLENLPPPSSDKSSGSSSRDWTAHSNARQRKGLVLFSGDLFSPSVESSVTRGTHLIPVINAMNLDCACLGNHDWDFGYPHLQTLMSQTNFPWLFSNVVDRSKCESKEVHWDQDFQDDDSQVDGTLRTWTTIVEGVKVGCIGIVEQEWIATVPSFPDGFVYRNMAKTAIKLSQQLRDPKGEACDLVIALTHSRLPNDIDFANEVGATSEPDNQSHGIDLVLGGHDHIYYIGNGATNYEGEDFAKGEPGTEKDKHAMVVKSGTDFRDLSELKLELSPRNDSAVRKRTIESLSVKRYRTSPSDPTSSDLKTMLDDLVSKISASTSQSVAYTLTPWDVRSEKVRTDESAIGNFIADVLMNSYEEVLRERDNRGELMHKRPAETREVDCSIICGGSLRGDQMYGPGKVALSDILEILPFEDAVVCKELKGQDIWDALENGLSMYPKQEGRFPQVAGLMVKWDSTKPSGKRLVSVELLDNPLDTPNAQENTSDSDSMDVDDASGSVRAPHKLRRYSVTKVPGGYEVDVHRPALRSKGPIEMDKTYRVVTREYLSEGYDGFEALSRGTFVVDHENGQLMSAIVRKFLLGASYIWRMNQIKRLEAQEAESAKSSQGIKQEETRGRQENGTKTLSERTKLALTRARSLTLLKQSMKHKDGGQPPSTPVKGRPRAGTAGDQDVWRMVVDQSPGGFRDALHVGGSEHHSAYDNVSRRFNTPSENNNSGKTKQEDSSSTAAVPLQSASSGASTGLPAAKRVKYEDETRDKAPILESDLFDPSLAPRLLTQIKELLALVTEAAKDENSLFVSEASDPNGNVDKNGNNELYDRDGGNGANIALGSIAMDEGEEDATLAFLTAGAGRGPGSARHVGKDVKPTQLSQDIVRRSKELKKTFERLQSAAKELPGGQDLGLVDQRKILETLEGYIARQADLQLDAIEQADGQPHKSDSGQKDRHGGMKGREEVQTSFKLDHEEMDKLREQVNSNTDGNSDIKDGNKETDDNTSLAFISPLVDGRLVDVARASSKQ